MKTYRYKGISSDGAKVSGVIKSYNEFEAVSTLRETCSIITKIEEVKESKLTGGSSKKLKEKDLALICSQFSIILGSGIPIVNCIQMVANQAKDKNVRAMLLKVADDVESGYTLAQSFENNGSTLPATFIETVRAGEESGRLETCFDRLHDYFDKSAKTKAKVISTLTYPALVLSIGVCVFVLIMIAAVPLFIDTFEDLGVELPLITRLMIGCSNAFTHYWWGFLLAIVLIAFGYMTFSKKENGRRAIARFKLTKSPFAGINSMSASAEFADTMSTMLVSGLSIVRALEITAGVVTNYSFGLAVRKVANAVEQGHGIGESMTKESCFSPILTEMTAVGESSGNMESTLEVIAAYFHNEVDLATGRLMAVLEPLIIVCIAVFAFTMLLGIYLPMFSMYGNM